MSRRKRRHRRDEEEERAARRHEREMHPEMKRGILVVFLFAFAALVFLSFFHIAGNLGESIGAGLAQLFGWDRFLLPIVAVLVGATLLYPERGLLSIWNYLGFFFFFISFNALLNLFLIYPANAFTKDIAQAGGFIGQFLATLLPPNIGYWGSVMTVSSLFVISVMLIFNTSLRSMMGAHAHLTGWLGERLQRRKITEEDSRLWQDVVEEEVEEPETDVEDGTSKETEEPFHAKTVVDAPPTEKQEERALTTRQRRESNIPIKLLDESSTTANSGDIERNKEIIEKTFREFGLDVEMGLTSVGPTVTQFTLRPAQGVKLARIMALQNDLALALAAHPIRIEAPIPGKSLVGIEVPNQRVATVTLRELLESKNFQKRESPLSIPLGKDVSGSSWVIRLEKMPHMLVAGATGSGKSVCLNTIITALLFQNGPDDLKLILVDPKRVELTAYTGIPHLLVPPITKVDDTVNALKWTVREMDRRLDILSKFGARDIDAYNKRAEERMPKIVIVIDELADLMNTNGREVEATIVRIAQMARAVGIHLVLATQRPSVDVITGTIKANIPGRLAFAVASQTDSRTILDIAGADKLLGRGDMLFTCAELSKPKRIQGAFISSDEVERVVNFLKEDGTPDYNYAITEITKAGTVFDDASDEEPMLEEAIRVILEGGKASTSYLQRRLRVGYGRAARMIDLLEEKGIVGPGDGAKPREVLIDEWPPGGSLTENLPTADTDYAEAYGKSRADVVQMDEESLNDESAIDLPNDPDRSA